MENTDDFAKRLFELSENIIYEIVNEFKEDINKGIDRTLTYLFTKAFYIHVVKISLQNSENYSLFEEIYNKYRENIKIYYKENNAKISDELLKDIQDAFDNSFNIIESLEFSYISDSYEFRHHIIDSFCILRKILEKKSKSEIRSNIFDKHITNIQKQCETLF